MDVGLFGRVDDLLHGDVTAVVAVPDVVGQAAVEQDRLLRNDAQIQPHQGHVQGLDILVLQQLKVHILGGIVKF